MRVAVLGAGVIGVTAAYELARDGHEVTVVDRLPECALETSFANAGLIAPGHSYTWASPKAPGILWRSLFDDRQALQFEPRLDPRLWAWSLRFLRNCTARRARANTGHKARLCIYSQRVLRDIVEATGVGYHAREGGLLYLYRDAEAFARGAANTEILAREGLELRTVDADEMTRIDPALRAAKGKFAGAVFAPTDASGDARAFTLNLARYCADKLGVAFRMSTEIDGFRRAGTRISAVTTGSGDVVADLYVNCLGVFAPDFARALGVVLPIYPIKGYSVTLPIGPQHTPPALGGVDEHNLVAYARFGDRLRLTATARFAGYDKSHAPGDFRHMLAVARDIFPEGADYSRPTYWAGLRPMTPEGTPILGRGRRFSNMLFNVGHGHMGWTMAAGCARITADLAAGRAPQIDISSMRVRARLAA